MHDLDDFRKKMEEMEAAKKIEIQSQGLETFDMISERNFSGTLPEVSNKEESQVEESEQTTTEGKSDGEVFSRFLQTIRG
jgi:hypothetical protein